MGACLKRPTTPPGKPGQGTRTQAQAMPESQKAETELSGTDVAVSKKARAEETLKAPGRRLSESRMRENLTSGSRWQGMEIRQGDGTEALSQETESNGSAPPKSRRHPLTLLADVWAS